MKNNMQKRLIMVTLVIIFTLTIIGTVAAADNSTYNRTATNISTNSSNNLSTNLTHQNNQTLPDPRIEHGGVIGDTVYTTIQDAIDAAHEGDTIWLEEGTYTTTNNYGNPALVYVTKSLTFRVFNGGTATIDGTNSYRCVYVNSGIIASFYNIIMTNGRADYGGAIANYGILTINNCSFINNHASSFGGAIENYNILTVENSTFDSNTANDIGAGAIDNYESDDSSTVTGSDFINNHGGQGGAIYGSVTAHFNRFIGNSDLNGYTIYGSGNAANNWWGDNNGPAGKIAGGITANTWLVLNIIANPTAIYNGGTSQVTADLQHDNLGNYYDPITNGHVPDGIPVNFSFNGTPLGTLNINPAYTNNGTATTTFTANAVGTSHVLATVDSQTVGPADIQINEAADISVNKAFYDYDGSYQIFTANYGDYISTRILVTNYGPDVASNIVVSDILGAGLNFTNDWWVDWEYDDSWSHMDASFNPVTMTWTIPSLAVGQTAVLDIITQIMATGTLQNYAQLDSADYYDWNNTNNNDTAILNVPHTSTAITVDSKSGYKGDSVDLTAILMDTIHNVPIAGKNVNFYVNGVLVGSDTTDTNGVATYTYNILENIGFYTILAEFAQDNAYAASSNTSTLTVNAIPTNLTVDNVTGNKGKSVNLEATLWDTAHDKAISGKTVDFYVNGVKVGSAITDTNGVATLLYYIDLVGGNYTICAEFVADTQYSGSTGNGTLKIPQSNVYVITTVNKNNPAIGETITITFKLGNKGPDGAEQVLFTYVIPDGLQFVGVSGDGDYSYDADTRTITWNLGNVPANTDPYLYLLVKPLHSGSFSIDPEVSLLTHDPDLSSNLQFATIDVVKPKVHAATKSIPLQETGLPIAGLVLAVLAVFSGLATSKKF